MSKKNVGYIKVSRDLIHDPIYNNGKPFNLKEILLDLNLRAFHTDTNKLYLNKMRYYQRGQVEGSIRQFADWWNMSKSTVTDRLEELRASGYILVESSPVQTVITVLKYCNEQDKLGFGSDTNQDTKSDNESDDRGDTIQDAKVDAKVDNYKNDKECNKNYKNDKRMVKKEKTFDFEDY